MGAVQSSTSSKSDEPKTKTHLIELEEWQCSVYDAFEKYRFVIVAAGRQSGKTFLGVLLHFVKATSSKSICWWVSPIYLNAKIAFRRFVDLLDSLGISDIHVNKSELRVEFSNGSSVEFKSSDREEGLRGETVNFMVIDEMGLIKRDAWEYALRGTITATEAQVLFIGTPKGKNLFHELYVLGQNKDQSQYISFQFPSNASKYFKDWENVNGLPQRIFEQEYEAKFIDDGGEVFRGIRECIGGSFEPKKSSYKSYYAGVDLAKSHDYTVVYILDNHGHMVFADRFNDIAWTVQKQRIINACKHYDAYVLLDSTGLGDPILDDLSPHIRVDGYKFTNVSKRQLIEFLAITMERREITFPEIPELINELSTYTFDQTEGGVIRYNAPEGLFDDCVISLALATWACKRGRGNVDMFEETGSRMEYDF